MSLFRIECFHPELTASVESDSAVVLESDIQATFPAVDDFTQLVWCEVSKLQAIRLTAFGSESSPSSACSAGHYLELPISLTEFIERHSQAELDTE